MIRYIKEFDVKIAVVSDCKISNTADALDLMADIYAHDCEHVIIPKTSLVAQFFSLRSGLAGEILQKFSNYGMRLAIIGDFANTQSGSLADFIRECNKGAQVFFKPTYQEAVDALRSV